MLLTNKPPEDLTEPQVRLQLKADELQAAQDGVEQISGSSATAFLVAGLQLEDTQ